MTYNHFRYARKVDADNLGIYHNDMTKLLNVDKGTANKITLSNGSATTGDDLILKSNITDDYPKIDLAGAGNITIYTASTGYVIFNSSANILGYLKYQNLGGQLYLKECTTPTPDAGYGAIYTKNDNNLYFQDGAGAEHTVTIV